MKILRSLLIITALAWTATATAGHVPPPPPGGPSDLALKNPGDQSGGEGGIIPVYPVTGAQHQMPLESIVDTGRRKYDIGGTTYAHLWEDAGQDQFMLPHLATDRSREIIDLADRVFKNFKEADVKALIAAGNPILPLVIEPLSLPEFPEGWGLLEDSVRKQAGAALNSERKVRGQAFDLLLTVSGQAREPYRYMGLVDPDSTVAAKAYKSFSEAIKGDEAEIEPLLLLLARHKTSQLLDVMKDTLGESGHETYQQVKKIANTAKKKDLYRFLRDEKIAPEALAVGLEMLEIPSLRGDEKKASRKKMEKELKEIRDLVDVQVKRFGDKKMTKPDLAHILLWGVQAKMGDAGVAEKLLALSQDGRWWARLLCARSGADLWEQRLAATPVLLERQRDWVYSIRRKANASLRFLHRVPMFMANPPTLQTDSFTIDLWEKWWVARQEIAGLDSEEGWLTIDMKPGKGRVYGPNGLADHPFLEGRVKGTKVFVIDHNENGEYDYGIDNFATKDVKKPGTFLSQLARIDGKYYFMRMVPETLKLQVKPYDGPLGTVVVKEDYKKGTGLGFLVLSKSPDVTIQLDRESGRGDITVEVPAGHYSVYAGRVVKLKGGNGEIAHLAPGLNRAVDITAETKTDLKLGQQLVIDASINFKGGPDRASMYLELSDPKVYGAQGELYFNIEPQMSDLKVVLKSLEGKIIKTLEWKKEGVFDGTEDEKGQAALMEAQKQAQISELQNLIQQAQNTLSTLEWQISNGPPYPGGATLEEMQALQAQWQQSLALWQSQMALLMATNHYSDMVIETFGPVTIPLKKLPEEFLLDITGSTFFGDLKPAHIKVESTAEQTK